MKPTKSFGPVRCVCQTCGPQKPLMWSDATELPPCPTCSGTLEYEARANRAHSVIGDFIDVTQKDGLCWPDGTPRRFTSREELKRAEKAAGLRILERGERFRGDEKKGARAR